MGCSGQSVFIFSGRLTVKTAKRGGGGLLTVLTVRFWSVLKCLRVGEVVHSRASPCFDF